VQLVLRVGESASAMTYSASRDSSEPSSCSDVSAMFGEGRGLLLAEVGGMPAGDFGWDCEEGSEDLREVLALSRFEKKPRKAEGISGEEVGGNRWGYN
jgi:hypothetical protein